jgi:hypothetical protein
VLAGFAEKYGITFSLLSDEGSVVIRRLGLLNEQVRQHHEFYGVQWREDAAGVPYPGAFLLDERGIITEKRFISSYRMRETGAGLLEVGFGVEAAAHGPEARARGEGLAVRAYLDSDTYRTMQRLRLTVELAIEPGLHVYARPVPEGFVPLTVQVAPIDGVEVGELEGPEPEPFRVEGLDEQFFVYEATLKVGLPLTFTKRVGDQTVAATVRYQACSATDCLVPQAIRLDLPVKNASHTERDI